MIWGHNFLQAFVEKLYPDARIERLPASNHFRVSFTVDPKELAAQREEYLRRIRDSMRPKFTARRKLYWGKRALSWRRP